MAARWMEADERCGGVEDGMQMGERKMMLRSREVKQKVAAGSSPLGRARVHRRDQSEDSSKSAEQRKECGRNRKSEATVEIRQFAAVAVARSPIKLPARVSSCFCSTFLHNTQEITSWHLAEAASLHVQAELWRQHHVRVNSI